MIAGSVAACVDWHPVDGGKVVRAFLRAAGPRPHRRRPRAALVTRDKSREQEGEAMPPARCACGFSESEAEDYTLSDHLYEMFAPDDGKGPDGLVHLEGPGPFRCLCGAGGSEATLDAHFLQVFTPGDSTGRDGAVHKAAG
jgi:hypothetical protein